MTVNKTTDEMSSTDTNYYGITRADRMPYINGTSSEAVLNWYVENRSEGGGLRDPNAKPVPFRLRRAVGPLPAFIDYVTTNRQIKLVSDRFAEVLRPFLSIPPIRVPVSGSPKLTTDQWCAIVDVTTLLDAANLQASEACIWPTNPDSNPENLARRGDDVLDPSRIPANVHVFFIRRFHLIVYSSAVKRALQRAKIPDLQFHKHTCLEEPEASRQAYLKKLEQDTVLLREKIKSQGKPPRPEPDAACVAGWVSIKKALGRNAGKEFENHNIFDEDDFLEHNTLLRHDEELAWPSDYWAIAEDGRGGYWTLRVDADGTASGDVWYYDHELATPGRNGGKAVPNFESCAANLKAWVALLKKGEDGL